MLLAYGRPERRKIAKLAKGKNDYPTIEKYAQQGLEIDVTDRECQDLLIEALQAQHKDAALAELKKLLE